MSTQYADLPAISALLEDPLAQQMLTSHPRAAVVAALRDAVASLRTRLAEGGAAAADLQQAALQGAAAALDQRSRQGLRPLINATGVIVHTNLGRSVLAEAAARAAYEIARSYSNLEADLEAGRRGSRQAHVEARLREVVGAEAAAAFNNNAAAVMLALAAVAVGKEVIVSRGQLVEIGGSFRIPEVVSHSGCILREVGATNRTHLRDYEGAINENTAAILRVHPSNYRVIGFTLEPELADLAELAHRNGLPLIDDLGSGALLDLSALGVGEEPTVAQSLAAGADIVTFSGDKLLGGPQCGIAAGRPDLIERMKKHPFARAVRVDKMTLAALAATLDIHADPERALVEIPTLRMATEPLESVQSRAEALAEALRALPQAAEAWLELVTDRSARVGGGSLPEEELATAAVAIAPPPGLPVDEFSTRLRTGQPGVYARIHDGRLVLDCRTIFPDQVTAVVQAVAAALDAGPSDDK